MSRDLQLPKNIDRYLATLSKLYATEGERQLQEILVNAQVRVDEGYHYDNWNGGTYGHALFLTLPESLYLRSMKTKAEIQKRIASDINKFHNFENESIDEVFLEMEAAEHRNWRKDSGVLQTGKRMVFRMQRSGFWETPATGCSLPTNPK